MAQVTETVARGILAGHGYTDNEVRQLAHHWLASHGQAPADAAPSAGAVAGPDDIYAIALTRYKVVHSHDSMFHRFAVVAGDGKQQLYLGRETECQNMTRKFAGAFLDGAFYQSQIAAAPTPAAPAADSVPVLPDFDTVEQHIYGACRRYITQDMLEPIHNLIRDAIDADRAARASAESVPAPVPPPECETEAEKRAFAFGWFKALESERMKAESVREDAERWRELREQHESDEDLCCVFAPNDMRECLVPVGSLPGELDAFMDSERAARKQGASHDR